MTATTADPLVLALAGLLMKATLVIALAVIVRAAAARWLSASGRHLVMALTVVMLLALPLLALLLPSWAPPVPIARSTPGPVPDQTGVAAGLVRRTIAGALTAGQVLQLQPPTAAPAVDAGRPESRVREADGGAIPATTRVPWTVVLLVVQVAGTFVMLVHLGVQRWRVHQLAAAADAVTDAEWLAMLADGARTIGVQRAVRLLRSRRATMPMTFGTMRPAILLPATADTWDDDRRRAVLWHELAHVARFDCLAQWAACAMRAVYWMHPAAWWLVSRLRLDREFACDDLVLAAGAPPVEYARHLLDIAYTFGGGRAPALAVRMARRSQLEGRLRALLDDTRRRREPSRPARVATTIGAFAVLLPLASATAPVSRPVDYPTAPTVADAPAPRTWSAPASAVATGTARAQAPVAAARTVATTATQAAASATAAQAASGGDGCTWEVRRGNDDTVQLSTRHGRSQSGRTVPLSALEGLTAAQLTGGGAVRFMVRRDAGTFTFEGTARDGAAAGVCGFTPSATFGPELAKRGITGLTPGDQLEMARHDVSLAFVDELKTQKYATPTVADLVKAGQHGVHLEYLRGMGALGYATGTLDPLITLRDHGVTPDYAKALASFGYASLPIDQLQRARDHGVTSDYLQGLKAGGYTGLPLDQVIKARDHGVTPDFVQGLRDGGFSNVPLDELINTRDHGVTGEYVKEMKALGFNGTLADLVVTRDHGVTSDYARGLADLGYKNVSLEQLRKTRDHGVTPDYVRAVQGLGYKSLTLDDLVTLRDHGVTADRIRQANARAGSQLTVAQLRDAASHGWR